MHGSKKWIQDYRGRWKRSNDRTKNDYYAGLKKWDILYIRSFGEGTNEVRSKDFCPQCKHVQKAMLNDVQKYRKAKALIGAEWRALYGGRYWVRLGGKVVYFWEFFHQHKDYIPLWNYDFRNYFCFKHERMYEQERAMWHSPYHGKKRGSEWVIKHERQKYRRQVKQKLARAKYDEDVYDEILPPRRGWLD